MFAYKNKNVYLLQNIFIDIFLLVNKHNVADGFSINYCISFRFSIYICLFRNKYIVSVIHSNVV